MPFKKIAFFCFVVIAIISDAQFIILDQPFDKSSFPNWTTYKVSGNTNWSHYLGKEARVFSEVNIASEAWLISNSIDLRLVEEANFCFDYKWQQGSSSDNFIEVLISTNYTGGNPNQATWSNLSKKAYWAKGFKYENSGEISLAPFIDQGSVHVAFRMKSKATSTSNRIHYLDNIKINSTNSPYREDIDSIYAYLRSQGLKQSSDSYATTLLKAQNGNGSFNDINYQSTKNIISHLVKLNVFANVYNTPKSAHYKSEVIKLAYFKGLRFWVDLNHKTSNWFDRHISYTMKFWEGYIIMVKQLQKEDSDLFQAATDYLLWGYQENNYMEASNGANKIHVALAASIAERNVSYLYRYKKQIEDLIAIQNKGEGIEADYMLGAHSGTGRQLYLGNYGSEYLKSLVFYIRATNNTAFAVADKDIKILEDLFIHGVQWIVYKNKMEISQSGRFNQTTRGLPVMKNYLSQLIAVNSPQKEKLELAYKRINNNIKPEESLIGTKVFWRFDFVVHRNQNYFSAIRMSSKRTVGPESGNGDGIYNYYSGSAVNYIMRSGKEYSDSLFYDFNYRQYPGLTAEQDDKPLPINKWGQGGLGGSIFAGGVANGKLGLATFIQQRNNLRVHKSTFYFDGRMVMLGAELTRKNGTDEVYTTLNQCHQYGDIYYKIDSIKSISKEAQIVNNPKWIWQDSILYQPMSKQSYLIKSEKRGSKNIFTTAINHGLNPQNSSFAYQIIPQVGISKVDSVLTDQSIKIVRNDTVIQAVTNTKSQLTQAVFYRSATLRLPNGLEITPNHPCALMLEFIDGNSILTLANPRCESLNPNYIQVTVNEIWKGQDVEVYGKSSKITLPLPQGDFSGSKVQNTYLREDCNGVIGGSASFDNCHVCSGGNTGIQPNINCTGYCSDSIIVYSSSDDGNKAQNTIDGDFNTRWSAKGIGEWIMYKFPCNRDLNAISIAFFQGHLRNATFEIFVSPDSIQWTNIFQTKTSGKTSAYETFDVQAKNILYLKIVGQGNSLSLWNSIIEVAFNFNVIKAYEVVDDLRINENYENKSVLDSLKDSFIDE